MSQLLLVTSLMSADMRRGLGALGLTEARTQLLWELGRHAPMTQRELADRLKVTPRNITTLVDALEQTGFVIRAPHPTDRRAVAVGLTDKGQTTVEMLQRDFAMLAGQMFGDVPEAELAAFARVLALAATRLTALAGEAPSR